jgi:hypothetical protein
VVVAAVVVVTVMDGTVVVTDVVTVTGASSSEPDRLLTIHATNPTTTNVASTATATINAVFDRGDPPAADGAGPDGGPPGGPDGGPPGGPDGGPPGDDGTIGTCAVGAGGSCAPHWLQNAPPPSTTAPHDGQLCVMATLHTRRAVAQLMETLRTPDCEH